MSLMKSLARVAAGVMLAKGIGAAMRRSQQAGRPGAGQTGGGILGDLLRNTTGDAGRSGGGGSLGDMIGQVLGGGRATTAGAGRPYGGPHSPGAGGGLGGLLDQLGRQRGAGTARTGRLGDLLGGAAAGSLGGLLGDLLNGPARRGAQDRNDASFGEVFNDALRHGGEPETAPTAEQNAVAGLMLRAMIQAAKADGRVDEAERERLLGHFGDLDDADRAFIREQMAAPIDPWALARDVPQGLGPQIYLMSLLAIDFDSPDEAAYLRDLAQALGLSGQETDAIHEQVGARSPYA